MILQLLGIGKWLREAAGALLGVVGRYPWQCAALLLLCLSGWLYHGKGKALAERDAERAAHTQTKADYRTAMAAAERKHRQARADTEALSRNLANATDETARHLDADSRRNLAQRVRTKAPACNASGAVAAALPDNPGSDTGTDSGSVSFTLTEADALRRHEVRSTACEGWARGLIDSGLAVE